MFGCHVSAWLSFGSLDSMRHSHTFRIFCHAVALIIEAIGTVFIFLDTIRMDAQLHAVDASYEREAPPAYQHWYYHHASLGFGFLFLGMLVAAFVLWLEHRAIVSSSSHSMPCSPASQTQAPDHKA